MNWISFSETGSRTGWSQTRKHQVPRKPPCLSRKERKEGQLIAAKRRLKFNSLIWISGAPCFVEVLGSHPDFVCCFSFLLFFFTLLGNRTVSRFVVINFYQVYELTSGWELGVRVVFHVLKNQTAIKIKNVRGEIRAKLGKRSFLKLWQELIPTFVKRWTIDKIFVPCFGPAS